MNTPQEVMPKLFLGGCLEWIGTTTLRIHLAQHVSDQAIFPRRIRSLQHDQQALLTLYKLPILQVTDLLTHLRSERSCLLLSLEGAFAACFKVVKADFGTGLDQMFACEAHRA